MQLCPAEKGKGRWKSQPREAWPWWETLVHSHPSSSALASLPKGQPRHFLTFLFEAPPEITSDSARGGHRESSMAPRNSSKSEIVRAKRREAESRFLCAGKRPSVLLWFQLLCPSVNRVISHGPRCTHDIRSSSTWGLSLLRPLFSSPSSFAAATKRELARRTALPRPFFISTDRYFPHGTECLSTMCPGYSSATS